MKKLDYDEIENKKHEMPATLNAFFLQAQMTYTSSFSYIQEQESGST